MLGQELAYESYEDSGLEWLGQIPSEWQLKKSKYVWREIEDRSDDGEEQLLSVSQYDGVVPNTSESRSESLEAYKKVFPNHLVTNIMLAWMGGLGVSEHRGIVSPAYAVYGLIEDHNANYLGYLYRTKLYLGEFARRSKGVVPSRWRMYTDDFGQVLTLLPPKRTQNRIVNFLDEKTAEIDAAIAKKRRLIELLKEQKAILINRAVTRGLNPDAPMKDSGVPWIGEIPAHWEVKRLKHLLDSPLKYGANEEAEDYVEGEPRYIRITDFGRYGNLRDETITTLPWKKARDYMLQDGDILFARSGATVGKSFLFAAKFQACFAGYLIQARTNPKKIRSEYLYLYTKSTCFEHWKEETFSKATIQNIGADKYAVLPVVLPTVDEQSELLSYFSSITEPCDQTVEVVTSKISKLNEFKQTLIANAVTGKIKV